MEADSIELRQAVALLSALIYWGGVVAQALRVRRRIGKSPNITPRGLKEKLLWGSWFIVIAGWVGQPFIIRNGTGTALFGFIPLLLQPIGVVAGILLAVVGTAVTFWSYAALGDSWRIGINRKETPILITHGPYRFLNHPIYVSQMVVLVGAACLLPTPFSLFLLVLHSICVTIKALDEEAYLRPVRARARAA